MFHGRPASCRTNSFLPWHERNAHAPEPYLPHRGRWQERAKRKGETATYHPDIKRGSHGSEDPGGKTWAYYLGENAFSTKMCLRLGEARVSQRTSEDPPPPPAQRVL